ncbi:PEP-CTERM sorting domain-containing protein [Kamptonema cortianum]|nr:PEP-CTERM sorting domain-containing protein [Geitlerinema splendidum]MDK3156196.1 PEP-CTERM sorting domain-containing protein [Kamptonema cortianum]
MKKLLVLAFAATVSPAALAFSYTTSFESPGFAPGGPLNGQSSWVTTGSAFTVQTGLARTGSQSVIWSNAGGASGSFGWIPFSAGTVDALTSVWINISSNSAPDSNFGLAGFFSGASESARLVFDRNGDVRGTLNSGSTTLSVLGNVGTVVDQWVEVKLSIDTVSKGVSGSVKGVNFALGSLTNATGILDVDLYRAVNGSSTAAAFAAFDDYSVAPVPEPATLIAASIAALAVARRRRK